MPAFHCSRKNLVAKVTRKDRYTYINTVHIYLYKQITACSMNHSLLLQLFSNCSQEMIGEVLSTKGDCFSGRYKCDGMKFEQ